MLNCYSFFLNICFIAYIGVFAEIRRVSSFSDLERYEHGSPFRSLGQPTNGKLDLEGWSMMQAEVSRC